MATISIPNSPSPSSENHRIDTRIESGKFSGHSRSSDDNEKGVTVTEIVEDDVDINALIDDLQSEDGHTEDDELLASNEEDGAVIVPDSYLQADPEMGLSAPEVLASRKKFGMNAMKEERKSEIMKFLHFFIGPIPFVMIVCIRQTSAY